MMAAGELRWYSANIFCLVQLLSLLPFVCGIRGERLTQSIQTVPARNEFHAFFPTSAWMPVVPGPGGEKSVGTGATEAPEESQTSSKETFVTHDGYSSGGHGVSFLAGKQQDEPSSSREEADRHKSQQKTSGEESSSDVGHDQSRADNDDDMVVGKGKSLQELSDEEMHRMTPREGLVALLSQGKDLVAELKGTLDGIDAVVSLGRVTEKIRDEIRKDVQALNSTVAEEFANIEQLRQLQEAQTAVLRSQLRFLTPHKAILQGDEHESADHVKYASGDTAICGSPRFWYTALLIILTVEIGASIVFN